MSKYYQINCYSRGGKTICESPLITSTCEGDAIEYFASTVLPELNLIEYESDILTKLNTTQYKIWESERCAKVVRVRIYLDID